MGLTIHYHLSAPEAWPEKRIGDALEIIADYARHLGCAEVGPVMKARELPDIAVKFHKVGRGHNVRHVPIQPDAGRLVQIDVGNGCEPFMLGLCKYPWRWQCQHGHSMKRWHPTKISGEWKLEWFCKTQFAGQHGTAHFIRCHKTIISLLDFCGKAGMDLKVMDETGYWDDRNEVTLLKSLRKNEALLAAFGGLMKDVAGKSRQQKVESAIFDYPNFEHLEHEGWAHFGKLLAPLKKCVRL